MEKEPKLTKVNHLGQWHGHFFEVDGKEVMVECSLEEYRALGVKGAGAPPGPGKWLYSSGRMRKFDTNTGFIQEGQWAEVEDGKILVAIGYDQAFVEPHDIVDNRLKVLPPRLAHRGISLASIAEHQADLEALKPEKL